MDLTLVDAPFSVHLHGILLEEVVPREEAARVRGRIRLVALASLGGGEQCEEQIALIIPCVLVRNAHDTTRGDTCEL